MGEKDRRESAEKGVRGRDRRDKERERVRDETDEVRRGRRYESRVGDKKRRMAAKTRRPKVNKWGEGAQSVGERKSDGGRWQRKCGGEEEKRVGGEIGRGGGG